MIMDTFTQKLFLLCGFIFGPAFGIGAIYWASRDSSYKIRNIFKRLLVGFIMFIFGLACSALGWMLSGSIALILYPEYPLESPGELIASMFTLPGFITGALGLIAISKLKQKDQIIDFCIWLAYMFIPYVAFVVLITVSAFSRYNSELLFWSLFIASIILSCLLALKAIKKSNLEKSKKLFIPITLLWTLCQVIIPFGFIMLLFPRTN